MKNISGIIVLLAIITAGAYANGNTDATSFSERVKSGVTKVPSQLSSLGGKVSQMVNPSEDTK